MMSNKLIKKKSILNKIEELDKWLVKKDFKYYTLNYAPSFKFINFLSSGFKILGIIWRQLFRISPINFRKSLGLSPEIIDPQTTIILAEAYLELVKYDSENSNYKKNFDLLIDRLISLKSNKTQFFAVKQSKKIQLKYYKTTEEDIAPILTVWAGNLFINAYHFYHKTKYLDIASNIKDYFVSEHPKENINNSIYFYYTPSGSFKIWNASSEISAFLIKYGKLFDDNIAFELGKKGIDLIINKQNNNGSWFYGSSKTTKYIDNFHTAFILRSFHQSLSYYNNELLKNSFKQGLNFYEKEFFKLTSKTLTLKPQHWIHSFIPLNSNIIQKVDIRDCGLSIIFFCEIGDNSHIEMANKILKWTNKKMFKQNTYYAEKTWLWTNKIPYIDFQAWMLLANAKLLNAKKNQ